VQYNLPQAADLGIHVEHGTPALDGILLVSYLTSAGPPGRSPKAPAWHRGIPERSFRESR